jgi:hypothetical protein
MSKQELNLFSKNLVEKKLVEFFGGKFHQLQSDNERAKGTLQVLIESRRLTIYVKSKRTRVWPNIRGIAADNEYIAFVDCIPEDFGFYIVNVNDWKSVLEKRLSEVLNLRPTERIKIDKDTNTAIFVDQLKKSGKPYMGIDLRVSHLQPYKDCWEKLL